MLLIRTTGDAFDAHAPDCEMIVVAFAREEVDGFFLADALDRLLNLSDNPDHVTKFRDRVSIVFEDREADPREVHQIPEVVEFFRAITQMWPYWTHFVEKIGDTAAMVMMLLCDVEIEVQPTAHDPLVQCAFRDPEQVTEALKALFTGQNALYETYGLSAEENRATTLNFVEAFGAH